MEYLIVLGILGLGYTLQTNQTNKINKKDKIPGFFLPNIFWIMMNSHIKKVYVGTD